MFKNEEGFSLLELVVAVGIAGIIAAVALPTFAGLQDKATTTSATYAASASAAEALANSTIGNTGGNGSASIQPVIITISGLAHQGYNNQTVLWSPATASNGEEIIYTLTVTSTGEVLAVLPANTAIVQDFPIWHGGFSYSTLYGMFAYANNGNNITITASIASDPTVTQTVS